MVKAIYTADGHFIQEINDNVANHEQAYGIILDRTNFYARSGGQEPDHGTLTVDGKTAFRVVDTESFGGYVLHIGYLDYGHVTLNDKVICSYDEVSDCIFFPIQGCQLVDA